TGATGGDGSGGAAGDVAVDCPSAQVKASTAQCVVAGADGRLRPGQTAVVTVTGYIAGNVTAGTLVNQAAVTSATFDPDQTNNLDAAVVTPSAPVSDIQLIKTGPASAVGGRTVDYTITAENFGPSDASDVEIVDVFPAALTATAATKVATDRGTCLINVPASTVVCSIATLPGPSVPGGPGAKATITITGAMVDASRTASFTNTATITCGGAACVEGPSPKPDTPAVTTGVTSLADLAVTKTTATSYVPQPTQTVTYHVQVRNLGPSTALGVRLEDELPSGMTATGMSLAGGSPDSCDVTQLVCQIGTLPVGGLAEIEITARVGAAWLIEPVVQTARVTADTVDPVDANNTARWTHSGDALADLRISKTSTGLGAGRAGDSYTLTIQNFGPQAALEPEVRDSIPPGLAVGALPSGTGWSCGVSGTVTDGHTVTCGYDALNSLAVGEAWTIVIPVALPADADPGQVFVNTATVAAETKDPSEANNTASARDVSVAEADIEIDYQIGYGIEYTGPGLDDWQLVTDPTGYYTGPGSVRFAQITVRNNGPAEARDLQGLSNVAAPAIPDLNSLPAGCVAVNQQVVCALSTVALAASTSFRFVAPFTVAPSTSPGSFPDCGFQMACSPGQTPGGWASVSTSTAETDVTNNYDTAALIVGAPRTDLRISKVALSTIENPDDQHPAYVAGEKFGYRIDLWAPATWDDVEELNHLVADAQGVVLEDTLPAGFTATQVNTGQGTCDPIDPGNPGAIRCEIGTVTASTDARGAPHTVSIYVYGSIATSAAAEITGGGGAVNRATADSQTRALDGSPTFVEATVETDVIQRADLQVSKLPDADRSYAGTSVGYTVTALNNGPSVAVGVVVTDTLPPGLALDEVASPGCAVARVETPVGQPSYQVVECVPELEGSAAGVIPAGASANLRIVASTDPRDLRPYWCAGQDPVTDPVMECPEVLPPADLSARQLVNLVEVTSDATDTKPENNSASVTTELATLADVAVAASVTTDTPAAGSLVTYNLSGVNLGPSVFDNPVVVVTLPPGFVVVEGGVQVDETVMTCEVTHVGEALQAVYSVTCSALAATPIRDSFEPGYTIPGGITVWIPPETPAGAYTATGHAYSRADVECPAPGAGTCESNYANNTASVTVNVVERADTSLEKRLVAPNPIQAGADVVYELTATNAGPSVAQDVTIADTVPAGMTYVSGEVLGGAACPSPEQIDENNVVKCQAGTIQPGESKTVRLTFHVDWRERGELCNTALVGSGALDPNAADNAAAACAETVAIPTDVGVTATADEGVVKVGGPVGYTVVVANNGPSPTAGTVVLVTVPAGLRDTKVVLSEHTGSVAPDPVCALDGEAYSCAVGDFWVGDTLTYRVTGTAAGNAGASLGIRVHVSHDDSDSDPSNDDAAASVTLEADDGSGGGLPVSGADIVWAVGAALALLAAGTALRGARRIKSPNRSGAL
ncbi:MAG: DUF11 domain-containing protein, partial [Bifidobacteriaceae bacterium]|nr:DUF11 domain-containing protein [Bifidobacteriaceae bacterium]